MLRYLQSTSIHAKKPLSGWAMLRTSSFHVQNYGKPYLYLLVGFVITHSLAGCGGNEPYLGVDRDLIVPGLTTRDEIKSLVESSESEIYLHRFDEDKVWVYVVTRDTWKWIGFLGAGLASATGTILWRDFFSVSPDEVTEGEQDYFLRIDFDDKARVKRFDRSSKISKCASGICSAGQILSVYAPDMLDASAKSPTASGLCSVYSFASVDLKRYGPVTIQINDKLIGRIVDAKGFFYDELTPGEHTISIWPSMPRYDLKGLTFQKKSFTCQENRKYYLDYTYDYEWDQGWKIDFIVEIHNDQFEEIERKHLLLKPVQ